MNSGKSPLLSEIEHVKLEIDSLTKSLRNPEDLERKRTAARNALEAFKAETKKNENALMAKLDEIKSKITENDFYREKIDQDFTQIVQNLKNNKTLYEDISEEVANKQQQFVDLTLALTNKEEYLKEQQHQLAKCERDLQREIDEKNHLRGCLLGVKSDLKSTMRQKKAIEEKQEAFENQRVNFMADLVCFEKEIYTKQGEIQVTEERIRNLEIERERLLRYATEMDSDLNLCQMNAKKIKNSKEEIEEKLKQETNVRGRLENQMKTLNAEKNSLSQSVAQSIADHEGLEAEAEKIDIEISLLNGKLDDEKRSFERLISLAEKENTKLEGVLNLHRQVKAQLQSQEKSSRFEVLRAKLSEIKG